LKAEGETEQEEEEEEEGEANDGEEDEEDKEQSEEKEEGDEEGEAIWISLELSVLLIPTKFTASGISQLSNR
jgi:ABC-type Zn2+ transport system substrate-binding protein/surface adhesin